MEEAGPRDKRVWTQNKVKGSNTAEAVEVVASTAMLVFRSEVVILKRELCQLLE